jgi:hypothetical protein
VRLSQADRCKPSASPVVSPNQEWIESLRKVQGFSVPSAAVAASVRGGPTFATRRRSARRPSRVECQTSCRHWTSWNPGRVKSRVMSVAPAGLTVRSRRGCDQRDQARELARDRGRAAGGHRVRPVPAWCAPSRREQRYESQSPVLLVAERRGVHRVGQLTEVLLAELVGRGAGDHDSAIREVASDP